VIEQPPSQKFLCSFSIKVSRNEGKLNEAVPEVIPLSTESVSSRLPSLMESNSSSAWGSSSPTSCCVATGSTDSVRSSSSWDDAPIKETSKSTLESQNTSPTSLTDAWATTPNSGERKEESKKPVFNWGSDEGGKDAHGSPRKFNSWDRFASGGTRSR